MSAIRECLARWICPELSAQADINAAKVRFIRSELDDLSRYCEVEVPIAAACAEWLESNLRLHFRSNAEFMADAERNIFHPQESVASLRARLKDMRPAAMKSGDA